ncbi:MAG: CotH kinase family protein, partial [Kiritimatiellae bacterium]|nr:CotH kinase family protein [Kiritimatiellia bacterium]
MTYDATGGGAQVATPAIDVSGVHVWTLTYKNDAGASLYKDGMLVKTAGSVKWSGTKVAGSVEFGARHDGSDPLTGAIIYAARTDFGNSVAKNADHVISKAYSGDVCPGMSGLEPLAWKSELFTHLAAYGDTEGHLALMPHRTSTYEYGGWHCPLDANPASGEYVDGLTTVFNPVVQNLPGVSTNAAAASVLAQIPRTAAGVIANITVVNGNSTHCVFARSNGDGTVSLGWENAAKHKTSGILDAWDDIHVWTLVSHETDGCKLYRVGELVLEDPDLKFFGYKAGTSIMFGNATNSSHPLAGMKVYAVHTDFGASSEIFDTAEDNAAAVFDSFDFMEELPEGATIDEKVEAFVRYTETGVAYEPPPVFDPENDEVAETCVLRISEIMPKPTDALNRGKLEGMDVNGLESGWVEVENTSPDKWANLGDYKFIRSNRGKKTGQADYGNFPSVMIAPGARYVFYTSERYSNSADMTVSAWAEADEDGVKPKLYGADLKDILVWPDKVNPKKSPFVRLIYTPTDAIVDTVVVPSDVPEGCSIIVGDAGDGEATKRWLCPTPTRGRANTATEGLVRIGPNAGPLYEIAGGKKHDSANEFARLAPPAVPGEDYEITFSFNPVMHPTVAGGFRDEDAITDIRLVYRTDLTNATTIASVDMTTDNFDAKDWGHTYTATIPHAVFDTIGAGHLIQWKFIAADASGNEWTSPSFNNPDDGYEWYGTIVEPDPETQMSATLPTWHMFASGNHLTQMDVDADNQDRSKVPNQARVAIYDSSTSNYYDYVRIDLRGNTSKNFTKQSHGLRFAKSHPLTMTDVVTGEPIEEIRKTSLISEFADPSYMRQMMAFWLWRKMGNLVPFDFPVRCNLNGEFYQLAFNSERFTDELIEDVYGLDKFGYGYKNVGTLNMFTTAGGTEKKTPDDENETELSVLRAFENQLRKLGANTAHDTAEGAGLTKFVVEKFDLPAWINYLASARITQEMDDVWANVCAYYDNPDMKEGVRGTGTWMPLGYDFNVSLGQFYVEHGMTPTGLSSTNDWFKSHPLYGGWTVKVGNNGNNGFEAVLQSPKFRRLFLRRLRTLMDQELKEPGTSEADTPFMSKMHEMSELMRSDSALDHAKWPDDDTDDKIDVWTNTTRPANMDAGIQDIWDNYVVPRREHLYVTHSVTNPAKTIGYGSNLNAGIPEAQSPIETLAPNISISNLTALDADEAEELGVAGQLYDTEVVVIRNDNAEVVDMSGWRLAFSVDFTFPAGTVCDANDSIYIVADRRAYIDAHDAELTDQVIVGNATFTGAGPVALYDADGALVYSAIPQTDELKYLRLHSFYGNTLDGDGDAGEWFTLTNISDTVMLDLAGVTVCFLKQGDPEEGTAHCHVTLENKKGKGSIAPLKSWTASQADYTDKGWLKIQNNKQQITIYDKYGSVCQSLKVTQRSFPLAYGKGGYLVCDSTDAIVSKDDQWHESL